MSENSKIDRVSVPGDDLYQSEVCANTVEADHQDVRRLKLAMFLLARSFCASQRRDIGITPFRVVGDFLAIVDDPVQLGVNLIPPEEAEILGASEWNPALQAEWTEEGR